MCMIECRCALNTSKSLSSNLFQRSGPILQTLLFLEVSQEKIFFFMFSPHLAGKDPVRGEKKADGFISKMLFRTATTRRSIRASEDKSAICKHQIKLAFRYTSHDLHTQAFGERSVCGRDLEATRVLNPRVPVVLSRLVWLREMFVFKLPRRKPARFTSRVAIKLLLRACSFLCLVNLELIAFLKWEA